MEETPPPTPPASQTPPNSAVGETAAAPTTGDASLTTGDIDVDLSGGLDQTGVSTENIQKKESYARWIAIYIILIFGISLFLLIIFGFLLMFWLRWAPDKANLIFNEAVIPFVEKIGTFATTVFGPLLAFILGYYFGEKSQNSHNTSKSA